MGREYPFLAAADPQAGVEVSACLHSITEGNTTTSQFLFKTCFKCHQTKLLDEFYKHSAMGDGYLNKCKECTKRDTITNRADKLEYYQLYDRERGDLPHRVRARKEYQTTEAYRVSHDKSNKKYTINNPGKRLAHALVMRALRKGQLVRPNVCQECGKDGAIHAHHCDYNKPLDVMWLCPTCHGRWHRNNVAIEPR